MSGRLDFAGRSQLVGGSLRFGARVGRHCGVPLRPKSPKHKPEPATAFAAAAAVEAEAEAERKARSREIILRIIVEAADATRRYFIAPNRKRSSRLAVANAATQSQHEEEEARQPG